MSSVWGNARAVYLARGMVLPPHDSLKDRILVELLQRERLAKVKEWEISLEALGAFLGIPGKDAQGVIMPLKGRFMEELFHLGYDMKRLQAKMTRRRDEMRKQREQMEKVNRLG